MIFERSLRNEAESGGLDEIGPRPSSGRLAEGDCVVCAAFTLAACEDDLSILT